jgi:hypothetical protein
MGLGSPTCRFSLPRPLFPDPVVTQGADYKRGRASPARNQVSGWLGQTHPHPQTPPTPAGAVCTVRGIVHQRPRNPCQSCYVFKLAEHADWKSDWSAQEPPATPPRPVMLSDTCLGCRPEDVQHDQVVFGSGEVMAQCSALQRYCDQPVDTVQKMETGPFRTSLFSITCGSAIG